MSDPPDRVPSLVDPETLDSVSTLTIQVRRVVEGLQGGDHASLHKGASVEFAEHRKYCPGDDIRHIDWRALARTDRHFVKQHEREVTLRCLLVVDTSASMGYRGSRARASKLDYARILLGALAHVLVRQGDAVGFLAFASSPLGYLPPKREAKHLPAMMSWLAALEPSEEEGTGFSEAIRKAAEIAGRRSMVALASDLWGAGRETETAIARLAARGHDVAVFHVLSPDEADLPFERPALFAGLEGEGDVDIDPALVRADYAREIRAIRERWRRTCGEAGVDLVPVATGDPPGAILAAFAARRARTAMAV